MTRSAGATPRRGLDVQGAILGADDPRWVAALTRLRHDIYHVPEYVAFASRHETPGTPLAFLAESAGQRLLIPLIVRPVPVELGARAGLSDATSPRGFPGPVVGSDDIADVESFLDDGLAAFVDALRDRGIVSAFIRLHPFLAPSREALGRHGELVDVGHSFAIDLSRSDDELWSLMRSNHRRDIVRAEKAGYTVRADEDWSQLDGFLRAFHESMVRLDAAPHWRLADRYFADLHDALGGRVHLLVVEQHGELASAAVITEADGIAEYHLAGTLDRHLRASPSKLLIRYACGWARARGDRVLHLAGTPRPGDSLSHFKAGFSPARHPMRAWRVIADRPAYDALVGESERTDAAPRDPIDGWFPAYRRAT